MGSSHSSPVPTVPQPRRGASPAPLQPSSPSLSLFPSHFSRVAWGFPLGKKTNSWIPQPCLPLSLQELLPRPHLQKLHSHSASCKPTLTFSSESFSRSWMRTQPFPAPIAMENHETGSEEEHWVNTSQLYLKHLIQICFDKSCSCFQRGLEDAFFPPLKTERGPKLQKHQSVTFSLAPSCFVNPLSLPCAASTHPGPG